MLHGLNERRAMKTRRPRGHPEDLPERFYMCGDGRTSSKEKSILDFIRQCHIRLSTGYHWKKLSEHIQDLLAARPVTGDRWWKYL